MIYSFEIKHFPTTEQYTECITYQDENGFDWKIAIVKNGFFVAYFGNDYFKDKYLDLIVDGENQMIMNTGCFFIQNTDFDAFYDFREILKNGFTDDIWNCIGVLIQERLEQDSELTECEIVR